MDNEQTGSPIKFLRNQSFTAFKRPVKAGLTHFLLGGKALTAYQKTALHSNTSETPDRKAFEVKTVKKQNMVIVGAEIPPVPEGRPPSVHEPIEYQRHDLHHFEGKFKI